jgi:hypothetical protein
MGSSNTEKGADLYMARDAELKASSPEMLENIKQAIYHHIFRRQSSKSPPLEPK